LGRKGGMEGGRRGSSRKTLEKEKTLGKKGVRGSCRKGEGLTKGRESVMVHV